MKTNFLISFLTLFILAQCLYAQQKLNFTPITDGDTSLTPIESAFNNKLNDVKLVGLGEATHGDKTTFAFNFKMVKYLVGERGFKTLMLEIPNTICNPFNKFIQSDSAYAAHQIDTLVCKTLDYDAYCDLQFVSLIKWLKDYNLSHRDQKVSIKGMSVDVVPKDTVLKYYIKPYDSAGAAAIAQKWKAPAYSDFYKWDDIFNWEDTHTQLLASLPDATRERIITDLDRSKTSLELYLDVSIIRENKNELVVPDKNGKPISLDKDNFFRKLRANPDYNRRDSLNRFTVIFNRRDSLMAVYTLAAAGNSLSIVWAHDAHVEKPGYQMMGDYLNKALGKQYFTIITDYSQGGSIVTFSPLLSIKKSPDAMAGHSIVKDLNHKYGITKGIVFSNDLGAAGYTGSGIHIAGIDGVFSISSVTLKAFNAMAVVGALQPRDFMKQK